MSRYFTWRTVVSEFVFAALFLLLGMMLAIGLACTGVRGQTASTMEVAVRTALNLTADIVDPAYALAVEGCKDRQSEIYGAALDGGDITVARGELATVQARCRKVVAAFDEIREWHDLGWAAVEDGRIGEAQVQVDKIREAWRTLPERTTTP